MYLGKLLVGGEVLLVLGVLEVVLLEVGPQLLDALSAGSLLLADDVSELSRELHGLGQSLSLGHGEDWLCTSEEKEVCRIEESCENNLYIQINLDRTQVSEIGVYGKFLFMTQLQGNCSEVKSKMWKNFCLGWFFPLNFAAKLNKYVGLVRLVGVGVGVGRPILGRVFDSQVKFHPNKIGFGILIL